MGKSNRTAAPWRRGYADGSGEEIILNEKGTQIATLRWGCGCCQDSSPLDADELAVGKLIVNSPMLLQALKDLLGQSITNRALYYEKMGGRWSNENVNMTSAYELAARKLIEDCETP